MYNKISNKLIYSVEENKKGIIKECADDKSLLIMNYLYQHEDRRGEILFSLDYLINCFDMKSNTKTIKSIRNILSYLIEDKITSLNVDINDVKPKDFVIAKILIDMSNQYFELHDEEYDKIMSYDMQNIDNVKLLTLYCDIKCRMYKRAKDKPDLVISGGRAEYCYPSYLTFTNDINITEGVITKYINILWDLDLIRYNKDTNTKQYHQADNNKTQTNMTNIYVMYQNGWENELKEGIKLYKIAMRDKGYFFVEKENKTDYSLAGKKGVLTKKINNETATKDNIDEYNKIIEIEASKNGENDKKWEIQYLLNNHEGESLYTIYDGLNRITARDEIEKLENSLELFDENDELLVDWNYYKYIMINYKEDKHDYFVNCINKHKKVNKPTNVTPIAPAIKPLESIKPIEIVEPVDTSRIDFLNNMKSNVNKEIDVEDMDKWIDDLEDDKSIFSNDIPKDYDGLPRDYKTNKFNEMFKIDNMDNNFLI